ncbi:amidase [Nocardioides sp. YIM 152315]|uniref:amidase n=1 Tax=Nocardioides sp. YIM 152315 TaxID=3031760 RepID=UPI0023DA675D|nr:amidase [Nocardioides sp. YIM 152315]MDF1604514.1 amidase [Nocardioides sp. YIM 152315]
MDEEEFATADATALAGSVRDGAVSATELVDLAAAAMERLNPLINAVTYECLDQARAESRGELSGPFAGVPILLKDLGAAVAGHPDHQGNPTLAAAGRRHQGDSWLVQRLRAAGFLVVGRTNVPELGLCSDSQNAAFGVTRNPWHLARTPSGSSGGSAAAVSSGMVPLAHGNDGGGSIRMPAAQCGLVGHKASRGLVSDGPGEADSLFGHAVQGFLTRSVRDTAAVLDLVAGPGVGDPVVAPRRRPSLVEALGETAPLRVGYVAQTPEASAWSVDPAVAVAVHETVGVLRGLGHEVVESHPGVMFDPTYWERWFDLLSPAVALAVEDLEETARGTDGTEWHDVVTEHWARRGREISAADHTRALLWLDRFRRDMATWWADGFDVLLSPVTVQLPLELGSFWSYPEGVVDSVHMLQFTPQFNSTGAPAVSVPATWTDEGLPVGVQLAGRYGEDHVVLRLAAQLEAARPWAHRYPARSSVGVPAERRPGPGAEHAYQGPFRSRSPEEVAQR